MLAGSSLEFPRIGVNSIKGAKMFVSFRGSVRFAFKSCVIPVFKTSQRLKCSSPAALAATALPFSKVFTQDSFDFALFELYP